MAVRRADRDLVGLADPVFAHPDRRLQHVRAHLGLPDCRRPVLVGAQARRAWLVVVHRLVQRDRADRHRRLGGLLLRLLRDLAVRPLGLGPRLRQLRRRRSRARRDLLGVRADPRDPLADQHLLVPPGGAVQQHLGRLARGRRGGDHRHPDHRPGSPPERRLRLHRAAQPLRLPDGHVLVVRPARRVPADHLHDHGLRRLRARLRGDP